MILQYKVEQMLFFQENIHPYIADCGLKRRAISIQIPILKIYRGTNGVEYIVLSSFANYRQHIM